MQQHSDYDIAQQRITEREKKKNTFYLWLILLGIVFLVGLIGGGQTGGLLWPIAGLIGILTAAKGIQLYYDSPKRTPPENLTRLEMSWLFGDDWQEHTGNREYVFAQDRIRRRYISRWIFLLHTIIFLLANLFIFALYSGYKDTGEPGGEWWLIFPTIWLFFYLRHAFIVFAGLERLEKRERKLGDSLRYELYAIHPNNPK
jgi:hypothetical protein